MIPKLVRNQRLLKAQIPREANSNDEVRGRRRAIKLGKQKKAPRGRVPFFKSAAIHTQKLLVTSSISYSRFPCYVSPPWVPGSVGALAWNRCFYMALAVPTLVFNELRRKIAFASCSMRELHTLCVKITHHRCANLLKIVRPKIARPNCVAERKILFFLFPFNVTGSADRSQQPPAHIHRDNITGSAKNRNARDGRHGLHAPKQGRTEKQRCG